MNKLFQSLIFTLLCVTLEFSQPQRNQVQSERESVLRLLRSKYGNTVDSQAQIFPIGLGYVLTPRFSNAGLLIAFTVAPQDSQMPNSIPAKLFDKVLKSFGSIKPIGELEESQGFGFCSGGRCSTSERHSGAYLDITSVTCRDKPCAIAYATAYYLHKEVVVVRLPPRFLEEATSFGMLCINGNFYRLPKSEVQRILGGTSDAQTVLLSGPIQKCKP